MKLLIQYLFLSLTVLAFSGAQASAANSGHMLDNIELIPGEKTSYLTLKGYFEPELFQEISIPSRRVCTRNPGGDSECLHQQSFDAGQGI